MLATQVLHHGATSPNASWFSCFLFVFETESHFSALADLEFTACLPGLACFLVV